MLQNRGQQPCHHPLLIFFGVFFIIWPIFKAISIPDQSSCSCRSFYLHWHPKCILHRDNSRSFSNLRHRVSKNMTKQPLTAEGGGISNRWRETPGFLAERGFPIRFIPGYLLSQSNFRSLLLAYSIEHIYFNKPEVNSGFRWSVFPWSSTGGLMSYTARRQDTIEYNELSLKCLPGHILGKN